MRIARTPYSTASDPTGIAHALTALEDTRFQGFFMSSESSTRVRKRVDAARERQRNRFAATGITCNAEMGAAIIGTFCRMDAPAEKLLKAAVQQLHLSVRIYHRVLKLARTIADLAENDSIMANHLAEAIQYRPRW